MIFLDTSFLYPLLSEEDVDHTRVREVFETYRGRPLRDLLITTNLVVGETITLIRTTPPRSHAAAVKAGRLHPVGLHVCDSVPKHQQPRPQVHRDLAHHAGRPRRVFDRDLHDANNQVSTLQYDSLCRLTRTDLPLGAYEMRDYLDLGNPNLQRTWVRTPLRSQAPAASTP